MLDKSLLEEEWEGSDCVEHGMLFLGKKGKGRHSRQEKERKQGRGQRCVKECSIQGALHFWVMFDPWVSVV